MSNLATTQSSLSDVLKGPKMLEAIAEVVPKHITPERMIKVGLMALNKTPKLAECSRDSFLQAMMDCSSLGLEPDGRRCHLIPYGKTCQLIIDYKGLIELAKRSGEVALWRAETVKESDVFTWRNGEVDHVIDFRSDRGELQCVYSIVQTKDGETDIEVMTLAEVEAIRNRSKAGKSGPWVTDYEEMAKKTVIRRHSKRLTLSPEFQHALDKDGDKVEFGAASVVPQAHEVEPQNPFERINGHEASSPEPDAIEAPPTLEALMARDNISESSVLNAAADAGVCDVEISSISGLTPEQRERIEQDWDGIVKGE